MTQELAKKKGGPGNPSGKASKPYRLKKRNAFKGPGKVRVSMPMNTDADFDEDMMPVDDAGNPIEDDWYPDELENEQAKKKKGWFSPKHRYDPELENDPDIIEYEDKYPKNPNKKGYHQHLIDPYSIFRPKKKKGPMGKPSKEEIERRMPSKKQAAKNRRKFLNNSSADDNSLLRKLTVVLRAK